MQIAAYYFPNYHVDKRNEEYHGANWTEWELMKCARPRFAGHRQPRIPLWGYEDEADPQVMAKKIGTAKNYGVDAFIFDWYWYDQNSYLQRALDEGFLPAVKGKDFKFALMWANHDWYDRHPAGFENAKMDNCKLLYKCDITPENITEVWDHLIERYFASENYWKIDGKLYFSIYSPRLFIARMGGVAQAAKALEELRNRVSRAGLPELHLNAVMYDNLDSAPECSMEMRQEQSSIMGIDSFTNYNWSGTSNEWTKFPVVDNRQAAAEFLEIIKRNMKIAAGKYYPVITTGFDASPRTIQSDVFREGVYPFVPVMESEPESFAQALEDYARLLPDKPAADRIIFINAWNEWTEGSYLEPDDKLGFAMLEKLKRFKEKISG
ncbi:MAG: glycoside hydrolase family 99-like domain-containing protein [Lentisphaeria bacterium]|nr:glycoside hydrolase family 99-like domain-containing protein [Lentisphaeria bacterium]